MAEHSFKKSNRRCEWLMENISCDGKVICAPLFNKQLPAVSICENHLSSHRIFVSLMYAGYDAYKLLDMLPNDRTKLTAEIILVDWDKI